MRDAGPAGSHVLRRAIGGRRRQVAAASLLAVGHQGSEAMVPVVIGVVIDDAVATGASGALLRWLLVLAALFFVLSTCYRTSARIAEQAGEQAAHQLRLDLGARVLDPRGGADKGRLPGELTAVATGDAKRVGGVVGVLPYFVSAVAGLIVSAVALLRISVPLGLLVLVGIPPLMWLGHRISRPLERRSEDEQERAAHASGVAADLVAGLRVLKGIGAESAAVARYRRTSRDSLAAALRAAGSRAWHDGAILALTGIFIAAIGLVGAHLAMRGTISVGELVAAVGLAQFLLGPFQLLTYVNGEFAQGRASAGRIAEVLGSPAAVGDSGTGGAAGARRVDAAGGATVGRLRLHGVAQGALRGVDFDVAAGSLVGVVARDPAAAEDLLRCLGRERDPEAGTVELDGTPLTALGPDVVRQSILVAHHDADLFERSLLDNVRAGTSVGADAVGEAMGAAAADEVAAALPDGVDSVFTERGRSLSGGQRQRVALARAFAADRPVLVLHDPTTAVDTVTESRIAARLREFRRGRTTLLVTTSPALLAVTDRVVVLDGGVVVAEGRHPDLVAANESYRSAVLA
ncbi:ABC transporter ATP-binding protein [Streptomyces candidus]|uniref:Putative ABC transport system ATP-binding protein n=1 Tax=Streptomyces candidus TaxID=67283 RepID=A0A7X0HK02_9ACTN|nr:ABC transporter ATP-binding protein [Streptomyces candidus]MBB6437573.1 putative ABC transport system ATP-binding protein [Streptomyces candidus]GHH53772.1 multidrug ABC transporter ATP-binding protein [Streptomyces candidus]